MILKHQGQLLLGIQKQRGQKLHTGLEPVNTTGSQAHAQEMPGSSPWWHLHARNRYTTTAPAALQVQLGMDGLWGSANPRSLIHFGALTKTLKQSIHQGWGQIQLWVSEGTRPQELLPPPLKAQGLPMDRPLL